MTTTKTKMSAETSKPKNAFLTIGGTPVYFEEDWDSGIGGGLWSTGLAMATYLAQHSNHASQNLEVRLQQKRQQQQRQQQQIKAQVSPEILYSRTNKKDDSTTTTTTTTGLSLLELGSGNGFLSVCFLALGHADSLFETVVLTDTKEHLALMERTLDANQHIVDQRTGTVRGTGDGQVDDDTRPSTTPPSSSPRLHPVQVKILEHQWGVFGDSTNTLDRLEEEKVPHTFSSSSPPCTTTDDTTTATTATTTFDYIIGSDVAYRDELHDPLIASLLHYSNPDTISLIGVTMVDTKPIFFQKLHQAGFRYERFADHLLDPHFRGSTFGIFILQKKK
jgi:Lysine methyltransferase